MGNDDRYTYYPPTLSIYRAVYKTRKEYAQVLREYNNHYGYKARIHGGWKFFESATDYELWKRTK